MDKLNKWDRNILRCFNCVFFQGKENDTGFIQIGRCIKNAPTIKGFPIMLPNQWCGEHRLDENKLVLQEDETDDVDYEIVSDDEVYVEPQPYKRQGLIENTEEERRQIIDEMFKSGVESVKVKEEEQKKI